MQTGQRIITEPVGSSTAEVTVQVVPNGAISSPEMLGYRTGYVRAHSM